MKEINIKADRVIIVDDDMVDRLSRFNWNIAWGGKNKDIVCSIITTIVYYRGKTTVPITHMIYGDVPKGMEIDHINGNVFDNRIENLRLCTHSQNMMNRYKNKTNKGVSRRKNESLYQARITKDKKTITIGYYRTEKEAAIAYNEMAKQLHGEYAMLNIID